MKRILLATAAFVSLLPCLQPSVAVYVDNAPHLVEVAAMADAWPAVVSWTDRANSGMVVGQLNAPLAWWPLASIRARSLTLMWSPPRPIKRCVAHAVA